MARLDRGSEPLKRNDVLRARRLIHFKTSGGNLYAQKWPRPRGTPKRPVQSAWVQRFSLLACMFKTPYTPGREQAEDWAKGTGWFWRDVFTAAASGNLIRHGRDPRVTTPTAMVERDAVQAITAAAWNVITLDRAEWDNNIFWTPAIDAKRLTFRSSGLYFIGGFADLAGHATAGGRYLSLRVNGVLIRPVQYWNVASNAVPNLTVSAPWYFNAGDYIELMVWSSHAVNCNQAGAWAIALTPEAVV